MKITEVKISSVIAALSMALTFQIHAQTSASASAIGQPKAVIDHDLLEITIPRLEHCISITSTPSLRS